ncbi:30S ribosomal protein S8 [Candidatus Kuenenbacteria bacterium]|nr:30S ribosomal protein S8 [Candidatus Kuenenbacteria bacterium]
MSMTDPIADMLTRIRNASMVRKKQVLVPYSNIKFAITKILEQEKYIQKTETFEDKFKYIKIKLKYDNKKPAITSIQRTSKVGRRLYAGKQDVRRVLHGYGISVVTTSRGVMTNKKARKLGIGGEIICEVY